MDKTIEKIEEERLGEGIEEATEFMVEMEEYGYYPEEDINDNKEERNVWEGGENRKEKRRRKKRERKKHYESGYRSVLIRLLLTAGAVSYNGIEMLPGNKRMYLRKLKDMEEERIVNIVRSNKRKIARINHFEKTYTKYIDTLPLGYYGYYNRHGKSTQAKIVLKEKNGVTAERCIRDIEIIQFLYGIGTKVLYEEKPDINAEEKIKQDEIVYYTIGELRTYDEIKLNLKLEKDKDNSIVSRVHGLLISPGGKYPVYHAGKSIMIWKRSTEGQMAQYISQLVNQKCEDTLMKGQAKECIIFGYNTKIFEKIYNNVKKGTLTLDSAYPIMYAIPYTKYGQKMIQRMTKKNWREELNKEILPDYKIPGATCDIACDGIQDNVFALNFCNADISRLKSFYAGLEWKRKTNNNYKFEIYCYPFQEEIVANIFNKMADIKVVEEEG